MYFQYPTLVKQDKHNIFIVSIMYTLLLFTPQLDNRQLWFWNITLYCMLEWRNCIGIVLVYHTCYITC